VNPPEAPGPLPEALLDAESLPSLPAVAMEVLRLAEDPNAEFEDYAAAIGRDPALAVRILKLANSSIYGVSREVSSLCEATSLLGLRSVRLMALGFSLVGALPTEGGAASFRHEDYWRRSLLHAVAGRELAAHADRSLADEAFLVGLLSHLGQLVLAHALPETYEAVLAEAPGWPDAALERRVLGFDHHAVADHVLGRWGIPDTLRIPVVRGTRAGAGADPGAGCDERTRRLARLAGAASAVLRVVCDEDKGPALAEAHLVGETLGLEPEKLDTLILVLEHRAFEATEMLEIELPEGEGHWAILSRARRQMMDVALGTAADLERSERRAQQLEGYVKRLTRRLSRDPLTGLGNRAYFDEALQTEVRHRLNREVPGALGLLVVDVDRFQALNDAHGTGLGDEVLRVVAQAVAGTSRATDLPARLGSDGFAVIVPSTEPEGLAAFAERLRRFVADLSIPVHGRVHGVTVSVGGATLARPTSPGDGKRLEAAATRLLETAKREGRDRCCVAERSLDAEDV